MTISKFNALPAEKQQLVVVACRNAGFDFHSECLEHESPQLQEVSRWMKLDEAAAFSGVSTFTIRRWATAGKIEFRKLNRARCGRILIRRESLYRFIESLEGNTQTQQEACNE